MHTYVNVVDTVLFKKPHVDAVETFTLRIFKIIKKMEQHFQDVAQKSINDKNLDSFTDHFA